MLDRQHILVKTRVVYTCPRSGQRDRGVVTGVDEKSRCAYVVYGTDTYEQVTRLSDLKSADGAPLQTDMFS